jgi:hypothetical protein
MTRVLQPDQYHHASKLHTDARLIGTMEIKNEDLDRSFGTPFARSGIGVRTNFTAV